MNKTKQSQPTLVHRLTIPQNTTHPFNPSSSSINQQSQQNQQEQQQQQQQQTQELLRSSEKLIKQIQSKKYRDYINSNRSRRNIEGQRNNQHSEDRMKLSTKDRIEGSRKSIQNNSTIADEIFQSKPAQAKDLCWGQQPNINASKKQEYLSIVQNMFGAGNSKKKRRRSRRKQAKQQQQSDQQQIKRSSKPYTSMHRLSSQLNQQMNRNVFIKASHHNLDDDEDSPGRNMAKSKKLNQQLQQDLQHFDNKISSMKSRHNLPPTSPKSSNYLVPVSSLIPQNQVDLTNRVSIRLQPYSKTLITNRQQQQKQQQQQQQQQKLRHRQKQDDNQLIDLSLSDSSDSQQQQIKVSGGHGSGDIFQNLLKQIDQDINNCYVTQNNNQEQSKVSQKIDDRNSIMKQNKTMSSAQQLLMEMEVNQEQSQTKNELKQNQQNQQKQKQQQYQYNSDEEQDRTLNKNERQNSKQQRQPNQNLFSFRENQELDLAKLMLQIPRQYLNKSKLQPNGNQDQENSNDDDGNDSMIRWDYNTGIPQHKIAKILSVIASRIRYSPAVIEPVLYEHSRQDNNQLQIDTRYAKQCRDRDEVKDKVCHYVSQTKTMYSRSNMYEKNKIRRKEGSELDRFKFDQFGKRMLASTSGWRSPGKYHRSMRYDALQTPILNGESCCQTQTKQKHIPSPFNSLLYCRSLSTLASHYNSQPTSPVLQPYRKFDIHSQSQQAQQQQEMEQLQPGYVDSRHSHGDRSRMEDRKCIMKVRSWDYIKKIRAQDIDDRDGHQLSGSGDEREKVRIMC